MQYSLIQRAFVMGTDIMNKSHLKYIEGGFLVFQCVRNVKSLNGEQISNSVFSVRK